MCHRPRILFEEIYVQVKGTSTNPCYHDRHCLVQELSWQMWLMKVLWNAGAEEAASYPKGTYTMA